MGLAGLGNFLLDVYQFTGDASALAEAAHVADGLDLFKVHKAEGLAFPTSSRAKVSVSYIDGSCGVGLFLNRLVNGAPSFHFTADDLLTGPDLRERIVSPGCEPPRSPTRGLAYTPTKPPWV